jgi:hypothetical protein
MSQRRGKVQVPLVTPEQEEKLKKKLEIKNFDLNAILRGAQLTVVGGTGLLHTHLTITISDQDKLYGRYRTRLSLPQSIISKRL